MNNELLLSIKKHRDTLIQLTETHHLKTIEIKKSKQMEIFSFSPPINLVEEGKWFLAVTFFGCLKSVFNITNENNSFLIT